MRATNYNQYLIEQELSFLLVSLNEASFQEWVSKARNLISKVKNPADAEFLLTNLFQKLKSSTRITKNVVLKHLLPLLLGATILTSDMINHIASRTNDSDLQAITHQILDNKMDTVSKQKGPDWAAYSQDASAYLKFFPGTPITGDMMAQAAKKTFDRTGTLVPIDLALAQGQAESQLGTDPRHRNPKKNPFSVGEDDDKTRFHPTSTQHGVQAYYDLMARKYLANKSADQLLANFVDTAGQRYATDRQYEHKMKKRVDHIRNYLNRMHKEKELQSSYATL